MIQYYGIELPRTTQSSLLLMPRHRMQYTDPLILDPNDSIVIQYYGIELSLVDAPACECARCMWPLVLEVCIQ